MIKPQIRGRYIGRLTAWAVNNSKNNNPQFVCDIDLFYYLNEGTKNWDNVEAGTGISAFFNLVTSKKELNQFNVDALKEALGWDGVSFASLSSGDWSQTDVQVTLDEEEYEGKVQIKVKYINPRDWQPRGIQPDPQAVAAADAQYGAMLRALGPNPRAAKPHAPAANGTGAPPPNPLDAAQKAAWKEFCAKTSNFEGPARASAWKEAMAQFFGQGVEPKEVPLEQWQKFGTAVKEKWSVGTGFPIADRHRTAPAAPFGDEEQFRSDEIPF